MRKVRERRRRRVKCAHQRRESKIKLGRRRKGTEIYSKLIRQR